MHGGREEVVGAGGCAEGGEELRVEGREGGNEGEGCLFLGGGHCCGAQRCTVVICLFVVGDYGRRYVGDLRLLYLNCEL